MIFRRSISPQTAGPNHAQTREIKPGNPGRGPAKKILVVDDDPVVLMALSMKLKSKGYQVVTASDGSQALSATHKEKPDLMVLDVNYPPDVAHGGGVPWDGFLIAQWLRRTEETRHIPFLVMSGSDRPEYKDRAVAVGATAFFRKPVDNDQLLASIDCALVARAGVKSGTPAFNFDI